MTLQGRGGDKALLRRLHALSMAPLPSPQGLQWALELLCASDLRAAIADIRCPLLAINGALDPLVPVSGVTEWMRPVADARSVVLPQAGHVPMLSHPAEVARAISDFARYGPVFGH